MASESEESRYSVELSGGFTPPALVLGALLMCLSAWLIGAGHSRLELTPWHVHPIEFLALAVLPLALGIGIALTTLYIYATAPALRITLDRDSLACSDRWEAFRCRPAELRCSARWKRVPGLRTLSLSHGGRTVRVTEMFFPRFHLLLGYLRDHLG